MSKIVSTRPVGMMVNGQVFVPAFPRDAATAAGQRAVLQQSLGAVALMDYVTAAAGAYEANRVIYHDPEAEREARADIKAQVDSARVVASHYRRQAELEAELAAELTEQKLDAVREFKPIKSGLGKARFAKRQAEVEVEESVAREGMREQVIEPQPAPAGNVKTSSAAKLLARLIDDLEIEIVNAEADGKPTVGLRSQQEALNIALRRKLMQEDE
jgi:hypothetical protein